MAYPTDPAANDVQIVKTEYIVDTLRAEDMTVHTRLKKDKRLSTWRLYYQCLSGTDVSTLDTYFETQRGYYQSDTWTNPLTSTTHTVRIKSYQKTRAIGTTIYDFTVELEEQP